MMGGPMSRVLAARYELLAEIGQGAMGIVYEARHLGTFGRCAVKILRPEIASDPATVQRFLREARASSAVVSEHVVRVFDVDTDPETSSPFIAMEYLEGEDLRKALQRLKVIAPTAAVKIVLQAALGLARAHAAGVVHRDIKPENLFLTRTDSGKIVVKILDFGVAKVRRAEADRLLATTHTDAMLGTPLYMSPEHMRPDVEVGCESDVWALGIVLWELLTGGAPFVANTLPALKTLILEQDAPSVRTRAPWVEPELADVVSRALARDPAQRYSTTTEFRDALLQICAAPELTADELRSVDVGSLLARGYGDLLLATTAVSADSSQPEPSVPTPKKRNITGRLFAAAGVLGALSVYGFIVARFAQREPEVRNPQMFPAVTSAQPAVAEPRPPLPEAVPAAPAVSSVPTSKPLTVRRYVTSSLPPSRLEARAPIEARAPTVPRVPEPVPPALREPAPAPAAASSASRIDPRTGLLTRFRVSAPPALSVSSAATPPVIAPGPVTAPQSTTSN